MRLATCTLICALLAPWHSGTLARDLLAPWHSDTLARDSAQSDSPELTTIFDPLYNLDYPEALAKARALTKARPNDPAAFRGLAEVLWLQMLFLRGGATVDHYIVKVEQKQFDLPKPPAELAAEFNSAVDKAIALSEAALRTQPKNAQALFDRGAAWAQRAAYVGSIEGSITGAFGPARRAFDSHERVLELAPTRPDANLVVGTYRYAVSTLGPVTRMFAYLAGFGGGRERGISMIEVAAKAPGLVQADALFALVLIYSREGRHADAVTVLRELERRYPRNRLLKLEEGAALIRAGHADTAETVLSAGLAALDDDRRPRTPGEKALWLYKRALSRLNQNHQAPSATDAAAALAAEPVGWVRGRIHVILGQLADLAGRRNDALKEYRQAAQLCSQFNDPACSAEAGRFSKRAFALQ